MILPGQVIKLGWNGAKNFSAGDSLAYEEVRVEAVGVDWVVVRDDIGAAHAASFERLMTHGDILKDLQG